MQHESTREGAQVSDEIETFTKDTLVNNLSGVCRILNTNDILIKGHPCVSLKDNEITMVKGGFTVPWQVVKKMCQEIHSIDIQLLLDIPNQYKGDVKFIISYRKEAKLCKFVAPWYVKLYCNKAQISPQVKEVLCNLVETAERGRGRCVYRGEHAIYPSVTSTLARYWNTNSVEALKAIEERNFTKALEFLRDQQPINFDTPEARESSKFEVMAQVQHMRGATNLIDFSNEIWVALFFACIDATDGYATSVSDGRVWTLKTERACDSLKIYDLDQLIGGDQRSRWNRQSGVVAIPDTGTIPSDCLDEVVRIGVEDKNQINEFLRVIGITVSIMYGDLEGYIRYGQDFIPSEALCYIVVECLQVGEYNRAISIAETLMRNKDPINQEAGYYLRGISYAFQGELNQACDDVDKFAKKRKNIPDYARENLDFIQDILKKNKKPKHGKKQRRLLKELQGKIRLDIDKSLWSLAITGLTYREH